MLIVRTTKARQSNLHDAGTIFWFTAGFGCKPPEIYPASTEPYWARINNRVVIYTARGIHDSHSFKLRGPAYLDEDKRDLGSKPTLRTYGGVRPVGSAYSYSHGLLFDHLSKKRFWILFK